MYVVGLTGGIGSGKSTVASRLADRGAHVIDADAIAREIVEPGEPALAEIAEAWPSAISDDGTLDRPALATIVFGDPGARSRLEAITHPRIGERIRERIEEHAEAERADGRQRMVVIDHPLLVETGQAAWFPAVIVVEAPPEVRVQRVVDDRGMDPADARARIEAQATDAERRAAATHVIDNGGDLAALDAQVDRLWDDLQAAMDDRATA